MPELEVIRLRVELERQRLAVEANRQQPVGIPVEDVGEDIGLERALGEAHGAVGEADRRHVEGPDAGVDDALGARVAALKHQLVGAVGRVVVGPADELGLLRRRVREGGIGRALPVRDRTHRTREGIRTEVARRQLVGPAVVHGAGVGEVHLIHVAVVELLSALGLAIEVPVADRQVVAVELTRGLRNEVDDTRQGVGAPHHRRRSADDFHLLQLEGIGRDEVPRNEAEEIEVEAAAVEQGQLRGRQRRRGPARRDVVVARGGLGNVDAGDLTEQLGVVVDGRAGDRVR